MVIKDAGQVSQFHLLLAGASNREKVPGPEHCETSLREGSLTALLVTVEKRSSGVSPVIVSDFRGVVNS